MQTATGSLKSMTDVRSALVHRDAGQLCGIRFPGSGFMFIKRTSSAFDAGSCRGYIRGKALRAPSGGLRRSTRALLRCASRPGMFAPVPTLLPDVARTAEGCALRREVASLRASPCGMQPVSRTLLALLTMERAMAGVMTRCGSEPLSCFRSLVRTIPTFSSLSPRLSAGVAARSTAIVEGWKYVGGGSEMGCCCVI